MKTTLINEICGLMSGHLSEEQNQILKTTLQKVFRQFNLPESSCSLSDQTQQTKMRLLNLYTAAKKLKAVLKIL